MNKAKLSLTLGLAAVVSFGTFLAPDANTSIGNSKGNTVSNHIIEQYKAQANTINSDTYKTQAEDLIIPITDTVATMDTQEEYTPPALRTVTYEGTDGVAESTPIRVATSYTPATNALSLASTTTSAPIESTDQTQQQNISRDTSSTEEVANKVAEEETAADTVELSAPTVKPDEGTAIQAWIIDKVEVRNGAGIFNDVIGSIEKGAQISGSVTGDWVSFDFNGTTGYIPKEFVSFEEIIIEVPKVEPQQEDIQLQEQAAAEVETIRLAEEAKLAEEEAARLAEQAKLAEELAIQEQEAQLAAQEAERLKAEKEAQEAAGITAEEEAARIAAEEEAARIAAEKEAARIAAEKEAARIAAEEEAARIATQEASQESYTGWTTSDSNVRTGPGTSYGVLTVLGMGTQVDGVIVDNWVKFDYNGKTGYISMKMLSDTKIETYTASQESTVAEQPSGHKGQDSVQATNTSYQETASSSASYSGDTISNIVDAAWGFIGSPYVFGATGPNSFDCSGLTSYLYRTYAGIDITRTTYTQINQGYSVSVSELQPGDLLFFGSGGDVSHVAIYVGGGTYIHAATEGVGVISSPISGSYFQNSFIGARRILN